MHSVKTTMMPVPLSLNRLLEHAGRLFPEQEIVSRLPDKSLRRHRYADFHRRARALASALKKLGLRKGDRVATLCWKPSSSWVTTTRSARKISVPRVICTLPSKT